MAETSIEWTDAVWNPVTGCTKVSAGCKNCYAERIFPRAYSKDRVTAGARYRDQRRFTDVWTHPDRLDQPLRWRKPRRVFVNSMSDLFHEDVPNGFIDRVFAVMALAPRHTFQVLTKRPERMVNYINDLPREDLIRVSVAQIAGENWHWIDANLPLPNVWLGVSVEDQATTDERIPLLLQTQAAVRFVSYEPALGPVTFRFDWLPHGSVDSMYSRLNWIIVGGESGPGARPFDVAWARSTIAQCREAVVPVFVKQLGARPFEAYSDGTPFADVRLTDRKGGDMAEWPSDLRVREFPAQWTSNGPHDQPERFASSG